MNTKRWKSRLMPALALFVAVGLSASPAWAGLVGGSGYGVHESTMEAMAGKSFSGGLDLVYSQVASGSGAAKTRSFLKCEDGDWTGGWGIQVNMYDYKGNYVTNFADGINPYGSGTYSIYAQGVKVDPTPTPGGDRVIWFSMTGNNAAEGDWYTVTVDEDFTAASTPVWEFSQAGNWEVEWNPSGQALFAGKESDAWAEPHAIYIHDSSGLQKVVDVGGFSCGFAFDSDGNLYTGTYTTSGPADQQYVLMYTANQVATAISTGNPLTSAEATNSISLPNPNGVFLGPNDLECDPDGNVYVTANGAWDPTYGSDVGYVYRIDAWDSQNPPSSMTQIAMGTTGDGTDWQKSLAYDGSSNLADGGHYDPTDPNQMGNRLYVDQDFAWGSGGPDVVSGLSTDTDTDTDGVPDALDNAYQTSNVDQNDTDQDMYGNMADGDFNNNGIVNSQDRSLFRQSYGKSDGDPGYNPDCDMVLNGSVNSQDRSRFRQTMGQAAPYF